MCVHFLIAGLENDAVWKRGTMKEFTHFDNNGNAIMVDVTDKAETQRVAVACGSIWVGKDIFEAVTNNTVKKGDVLSVARVAGIMAAKKTWELIPMCHPLMLTKVTIDFELDKEQYEIKAICTTKLSGKTGVEMEALQGVTTALLTIYDMCKAIDKGMELRNIHLLEKSGGKSGYYTRNVLNEE